MKKIENTKEEDFEFIRQFSSVSVKNICSDLGILKDYPNIMRGSSSPAKMQKVRQEIERRLKVLRENR